MRGLIHMISSRVRPRAFDLVTLFCWFIIYSYIGWLYESIYCSLDAGRFVNRGFLYGPFCPIYGSCIVFMILLFSERCKSVRSLFLSCALFASALEYVVSLSMEHLFGRRWWDYSNRLLNINGRICIGAALVFGVSGVLVIRYLHPNLVNYMHQNFRESTVKKGAQLMLTVFLFDLMVSILMSLS